MRHPKAGQSIVEYLLLVSMIILAVAAGVGLMQPGVNLLYQNAATKANDAAVALGGLVIP